MVASAKAPDMTAANTAAASQAKVGERMANIAEREYSDGKALMDKYAPIYERLINANVESAEATGKMAKDQWQQYTDVFKPIETQFAADAVEYDRRDKVDARGAAAGATIQKQFDAANSQTERMLAARGVTPGSGRSTQSAIDQGNTLALAKAGAINSERTNSEMTGLQLKKQAIDIGRGVNQAGLQATGMATNQGGAALGMIGSQTANNNNSLAGAQGFFNGAVGATGSAQSGFMQQANQQYQANASRANATNSAVGTIVGALISDEDKKQNKQPFDDGQALEAMREIPVQEWDYKPGEGDGGHHVGPMAQDVQAAAGNGVAPGGKVIDPVNANGMMMAAIKALDKKVTSLTGSVDSKPSKKQPSRSGEEADYSGMEILPL